MLHGNLQRLFTGVVRTGNADTIVLLGMMRRHLTFTPVEELKEETNFELVLVPLSLVLEMLVLLDM